MHCSEDALFRMVQKYQNETGKWKKIAKEFGEGWNKDTLKEYWSQIEPKYAGKERPTVNIGSSSRSLEASRSVVAARDALVLSVKTAVDHLDEFIDDKIEK